MRKSRQYWSAPVPGAATPARTNALNSSRAGPTLHAAVAGEVNTPPCPGNARTSDGVEYPPCYSSAPPCCARGRAHSVPGAATPARTNALNSSRAGPTLHAAVAGEVNTPPCPGNARTSDCVEFPPCYFSAPPCCARGRAHSVPGAGRHNRSYPSRKRALLNGHSIGDATSFAFVGLFSM